MDSNCGSDIICTEICSIHVEDNNVTLVLFGDFRLLQLSQLGFIPRISLYQRSFSTLTMNLVAKSFIAVSRTFTGRVGPAIPSSSNNHIDLYLLFINLCRPKAKFQHRPKARIYKGVTCIWYCATYLKEQGIVVSS